MTFNQLALLAAVPFIAVLYVRLLLWVDDRALNEHRDSIQSDAVELD